MSATRLIVSAVLIGVACRLLQPKQPQSAIATVLILTALLVLTWTAQ